MGEIFQGCIDAKIDQKGRVSIPADFRRVLIEGDATAQTGGNARFSLLHRPNKNYLEAYSVQGMKEIERRIRKLPPASEKRDALEWLFLRGSTPMQLDDTGRVVISKEFRDKAGLGDEVQFVGGLDKFEIRNKSEVSANDAKQLDYLPRNNLLENPCGTDEEDF